MKWHGCWENSERGRRCLNVRCTALPFPFSNTAFDRVNTLLTPVSLVHKSTRNIVNPSHIHRCRNARLSSAHYCASGVRWCGNSEEDRNEATPRGCLSRTVQSSTVTVAWQEGEDKREEQERYQERYRRFTRESRIQLWSRRSRSSHGIQAQHGAGTRSREVSPTASDFIQGSSVSVGMRNAFKFILIHGVAFFPARAPIYLGLGNG